MQRDYEQPGGADIYRAEGHHRILVTGVGATVLEAQTLSNAFVYLAQVAQVLATLHSAGRVHQDINVANIIIRERGSKLVDLESAKGCDDNATPDMHDIGTSFFMATEVSNGAYSLLDLLRPLPANSSAQDFAAAHADHSSSDIPFDDFDISDLSEETNCVSDDVPVYEVPFRFNPLHDMESLLWVALYLVLCTPLDLHKPAEMSEQQWKNYSRARDRLAANLFSNDDARTCVIITNMFSSLFVRLHPDIKAICKELEVIRKALKEAYSLCESDPSRLGFEEIMSIRLPLPSASNTPMSIHRLFAAQFMRICHRLKGDKDIAFKSRSSVTG